MRVSAGLAGGLRREDQLESKGDAFVADTVIALVEVPHAVHCARRDGLVASSLRRVVSGGGLRVGDIG